uniref:non-specific serine/threonine protein kinase n=1 Tax=Strigamia maritima TaxID=126957 RepID=T1JEM6_STRMM
MNSEELKNKAEKQENVHLYCKGGDHPVEIGDTFLNKYTVIRKLGWGTFSTVWLCRDETNQRFVAVKIVKSARRATAIAQREIKMLKHVSSCDTDGSHRGKIALLLDNFEISGVNGTHICMVFEVLGDNLLTLIVNSEYKGISLTNVKIIIKHVLEALDYLHTTCRIIHTDIKPENVCVTENPELSATLADLGNACWVSEHFSENIQTCEYRSPEVIAGAEYRANADIWSTACMAFELATGDYLFQPRSGERYSREANHLAIMTAVLGDMPNEIAVSGKSSKKFFTAKGKLRYKLKPRGGLFQVLTKSYKWDVNEARQFADFLGPMLVFDPNNRASAEDCLRHQWFQL